MYPTQFIKKLSIMSLGVFATVLDMHGAYDDALFERLSQRETPSDRYSNQYIVVQEKTGCLGKYQMSYGMLQDLGFVDNERKWLGTEGIWSEDAFLSDHGVQERAIREAFAINRGYVINIMRRDYGLQVSNLSEIDNRYTEFGILAAAHLVGAEKVCGSYDTGQRRLNLTDLRDEIDTTAEEYAHLFS